MAINKTKAGTYAVDFRDQHGHRLQRTFDRYKDAKEYETEAKARIQRGEFIGRSRRTVESLAREWYDKKVAQGYERNTLVGWKNHVSKYIIPSLGHLPVQCLDTEGIEREAAEWNKTLSAGSCNKVLTTLAAILDLAKRYRLIQNNVAKDAERLKRSGDEDNEIVTPDKVYTKAELKRLIEATQPGTRERIIVELPALTGVRIGEALGATWSAMDLKAGTFEVRLNLQDSDKGQPPTLKAPKSKAGRRTLSLPKELIQDLRLWKLQCPPSPQGLIIVNPLGKPIHRKLASNILDAVIKRAGVKRLTPHGLRHTFCSLLIADGVPPTEVAHYAGHKDSSVTLRVYAHFVPQETAAMHNLATSIFNAQ